MEGRLQRARCGAQINYSGVALAHTPQAWFEFIRQMDHKLFLRCPTSSSQCKRASAEAAETKRRISLMRDSTFSSWATADILPRYDFELNGDIGSGSDNVVFDSSDNSSITVSSAAETYLWFNATSIWNGLELMCVVSGHGSSRTLSHTVRAQGK